ncbi:MAG: glycerophosphodiester phosphodiesterase [Bacillota bacterium]|nr:glycerophosphodiester phosphodiesterase [Bacillota bacterium]
MTLNYAHRGASGYFPENTLIAFEKAIEMGCDAIETDVQMTRDGELVLIHDELVDRTTDGVGLVKNFSLKGLRELDAGTWHGSSPSLQHIPTAEELIILAKSQSININFELKTGIVIYPEIERKIIELIYKYNMQENVLLSSFNHYSMVECKSIDKSVKAGLLYEAGLYKPSQYCKLAGCDAIHPNFYSVNEDIIHEAKKDGIWVNSYTVNNEEKMKQLLDYGIDGIITNYPDRLRSIIG